MLHHDGCYGVPHLSGVVSEKRSLDTHSWQVILMSSISRIRPVINNSISAQPTQTDKRMHKHTQTYTLTHRGLRGINEKGNGYISGRLTCLLFHGGVCPDALLSAVHCWLLPGQFKLYYLLSLVHRWLRIWKAVTKFIWDEWEQIAWSRCYKAAKTKVTPLRNSVDEWMSVCCLSLCACVCMCVCARPFYSLYILAFSLLWQMGTAIKKSTDKKKERASLRPSAH